MRDERLKILKDNEEYCDKEEEKRKKGLNSDDSEGDGFEDEEAEEEEARLHSESLFYCDVL